MNALNVAEYTHTLGSQAKAASALMARAPAAVKNKALRSLARLLREHTAALQVDNARDLERAAPRAWPNPWSTASNSRPRCSTPAPKAANSWPPWPT